MSDAIGVLLINLGTTQAPIFWPMRRYLKEFLSDKRVVETAGLVWWLVLNGIILNSRCKEFYGNDGQEFLFVPCLNDNDEGAEMLVHLVNQQLLGWVEVGNNNDIEKTKVKGVLVRWI